MNEWLVEQKMSGAELSRQLGVSTDTISRYRTGQAEIPKLVVLAMLALKHRLGPS